MRLAIFVIFGVLFSTSVFAADFYVRTDGPAVRNLNGFPAFCATYREDCGSPGRLTMISKAEWKDTLLEINTRVNREIRFQAEPKGQDNWRPAEHSGDCEDYAILKRRKLVAAGVPASSMRFAFVENERYGPHVVLVVRTDDGDRVLDNTTNTIYPANKTAFNWISIQSRWNPWKWLRVIDSTPSP